MHYLPLPDYFLSIPGEQYCAPHLGPASTHWVHVLPMRPRTGTKDIPVEDIPENHAPLVLGVEERSAACNETGSCSRHGSLVEMFEVRITTCATIPLDADSRMCTAKLITDLAPLAEFSVLVDHRSRSVRFGPIGNLGMVHSLLRGRGIGTYGLARLIAWTKAHVPSDYSVHPLETADYSEDGKTALNRRRKYRCYEAAGLWPTASMVSSLKIVGHPEVEELKAKDVGLQIVDGCRDRLASRVHAVDADHFKRERDAYSWETGALSRSRRSWRIATVLALLLVALAGGWIILAWDDPQEARERVNSWITKHILSS